MINNFLHQTNGVSTFKMLQRAGKSNILHVTQANYERMATNIYNGVMLKDHDPALCDAVVQNFISATQYDVNRLTSGTLPGSTITYSPSHPGQVIVIWGTGLGGVL